MDSFNPTTKTQAALTSAMQAATTAGNPQIMPAHLLMALLTQNDGIAGPLLEAVGVDPATIRVEAEEEKKVDPVRVAMHPDVQRLRSDLPANASDQSQKAGQTPLMPRRVVHVRVGSAAGGRSPYLPRDAMHSPTTRRMHGCDRSSRAISSSRCRTRLSTPPP